MKGPVVENIILTVHLILAVLLIGVVLFAAVRRRRPWHGRRRWRRRHDRPAGGERAVAGDLDLAIGFLITSMTLTIIAARNASSGSIVDQLNLVAPARKNLRPISPASAIMHRRPARANPWCPAPASR